MTVYWTSFRIANVTVGGQSYDQRYAALQEAVRVHVTKWWLEPISFIAFSSEHSINSIATACKRAIDPSYDLFLIREMDRKSAIICGKNDDDDIFDLMPYLETI